MGNYTQARRSPAARNSWLVAALTSLALFSSLASAQTDLEKAAVEQQLMVDKMAAQLAAATTSPMATAGATCSAGTTTSTEAAITDSTRISTDLSAPTLPATTTTTTTTTTTAWTRLSGSARDVGLGGKTPDLWIVGNVAAGNGYGVYRCVNGAWVAVASTGATRIDVDSVGRAWIVDSRGAVLRYATSWAQIGTGANDIGVNAAGVAWMTGNTAEQAIYRYNGTSWARMPGAAVRVDVDPQGNAWVVNAAGAIYRWNGSSWVVMPGAARDIGIGLDGSVFVIGTDSGVYRWNGSTAWDKRSGAGASVSADVNGVPVLVNAAGEIYRGWK